MAKRTDAITIRIDEYLAEELDFYVGENGWFSSMPELANYAVHTYFEKIQLLIGRYNNTLDRMLANKELSIVSGSKLGVIYRMLHIDDYAPTAEEGVRQFTLWVTEGFGKSIDKLIASTDFYKSRVDFCRNAIVDFTHRTTHLFMAQDAVASEDKDSVKSSYVFMEQQYLLPINEIPDSWSGFQKAVKADLKDWLN